MMDGIFDAPDDAIANAAFLKRYPELMDPRREPWQPCHAPEIVRVLAMSSTGPGVLYVPDDFPPYWDVPVSEPLEFPFAFSAEIPVYATFTRIRYERRVWAADEGWADETLWVNWHRLPDRVDAIRRTRILCWPVYWRLPA